MKTTPPTRRVPDAPGGPSSATLFVASSSVSAGTAASSFTSSSPPSSWPPPSSCAAASNSGASWSCASASCSRPSCSTAPSRRSSAASTMRRASVPGPPWISPPAPSCSRACSPPRSASPSSAGASCKCSAIDRLRSCTHRIVPMPRATSGPLPDIASDVWLDTFGTGGDHLPLGACRNWSIRKRTLHGGLRDGVDLIEIDNGALAFSVLPTRGMGLWQGRYRGIHLGWKSPVPGPVQPAFVNTADRGSSGWLTGFDEWLCRCGLASNGPPGEDAYADRQGRSRRDVLPLHGRIANQPAYYVEVRVGLDPPYELSVTGQVEEGGLFYPHLVLTTTYTTIPGSNRLVIHDHVENRGAQIAEMQLLYHCNIGQPLLEAGSRIAMPI